MTIGQSIWLITEYGQTSDLESHVTLLMDGSDNWLIFDDFVISIKSWMNVDEQLLTT